MFTQYLYILNYETCELQVIKLTDEEEEVYNEDTEKILRDKGLNPDVCSWMFSDVELDITDITELC